MIPRSVLKSEAKFMSKIKLSDSLRGKKIILFWFLSRQDREDTERSVPAIWSL